MSSQGVLSCRGISKAYRDGVSEVQVLSGLELELQQGQTLAITGASGSGKSTLLQILAGLDRPDQGQVYLAGQDLAQLSPKQLGRWRNQQLGFVFQFHHLLAEFDALENVALAQIIGGVAPHHAKQKAAELLAWVGLQQRLNHKPGALSGGERQRVAIARALAMEPACLLLDEPTGNLDQDNAEAVVELLLGLNQRLQLALVLVTHDQGLAARMGRQLKLQHGRLS